MPKNIRSYLGFTPTIHKRVFIDQQATVIGQVELDDDSSVWPQAVLRGDVNFIKVGKNSNIQDGSIVHVTRDRNNNGGHPTVIGDNVTVGHGVMLHGCTIEDNVLIGIGAIILDGSTIEKNVIIAAGSVVPPGKTMKSGYLYLGNPAKPLRELSQSEIDFFPVSAANYAALKNDYL